MATIEPTGQILGATGRHHERRREGRDAHREAHHEDAVKRVGHRQPDAEPLRHHGAHHRQAQGAADGHEELRQRGRRAEIVPRDRALHRDQHRHHHQPHPHTGQQDIYHRAAARERSGPSREEEERPREPAHAGQHDQPVADPQDEARIENVEELVSVTKEFTKNNPDAGLLEFLTETALVAAADEIEDESGTVSLMTLHTAKGL